MAHSVIQGLQYCTKHDENYVRTTRDHFLLLYAIYWRRDELLTWHLKQILKTLELTTIATVGGYKVNTVVQCVLLQLIL